MDNKKDNKKGLRNTRAATDEEPASAAVGNERRRESTDAADSNATPLRSTGTKAGLRNASNAKRLEAAAAADAALPGVQLPRKAGLRDPNNSASTNNDSKAKPSSSTKAGLRNANIAKTSKAEVAAGTALSPSTGVQLPRKAGLRDPNSYTSTNNDGRRSQTAVSASMAPPTEEEKDEESVPAAPGIEFVHQPAPFMELQAPMSLSRPSNRNHTPSTNNIDSSRRDEERDGLVEANLVHYVPAGKKEVVEANPVKDKKKSPIPKWMKILIFVLVELAIFGSGFGTGFAVGRGQLTMLALVAIPLVAVVLCCCCALREPKTPAFHPPTRAITFTE